MRFGIDFRAEERRGDNGKGEAIHFDREIDLGADLLRVRPIARFFGHGLRVNGDAAAMKRGLDQAALARVFLALADEQAVAEKNARAFKGLAFAKRVLFGDEDFVHQRRVAEQKEALIEKSEARGVAELPFEFAKKIERAAETPMDAADEGNFLRTRDGEIGTRRHVGLT